MSKIVLSGDNFDEVSSLLKQAMEENEARFKGQLDTMFDPQSKLPVLSPPAPEPVERAEPSIAPPAPAFAPSEQAAASNLGATKRAHEAYGRLRVAQR